MRAAHRAMLPAVAGLTAGCAALALFFAAPEPWALRGDNKLIHFPMQLEAFRLWAAGRVPVWTDRLWMGYPLLANAETGAFYPPRFVGFPLTPAPHVRAFDIALALHAAVLASGTVAFLRAIGCRSSAACFGAVLALVAPPVVGLSSYVAAYAAVVWWPWLLLAAERLARAREGVPGAVLVASLPLGLQVLAGFPEIAFYGGCLAAVWVLTAPVELTFAARLGRVAAFGFAALMLAGPQLVPTLDLIADTRRGVPQEARALLAIDGSLLDLVDPTGVGPRSPFLGAATAVLAIAALALRAPRAVDLAVVGAVAGVAALGDGTPLYGALANLPVFEMFRGPYKLFVVAQVALLWLAALGLDRLLSSDAPGAPRVRALVAAALAAASIAEYGAAFRSVLPRVQGPHTKLELPLSRAFEELASVAPLLTEPGGEEGLPPRVFTGSNIFRMGGLPSVVGVEMVRGGGVSLLSPRHAWLDVGYLGPDHMNLLGVDLVLAEGRCAAPSRLGYAPLRVGDGVCVLANPTPRPRYELLGDFVRVASAEAFVERARRRPASPIGVAAGDDVDLPQPAGPPSANDRVEVRRHAEGDVALAVSTERARLLLVRQSWSAGWRATVDDRPAPIHAAAGLFFAVPVPAGSHDVALSFRAPGLRAGLALAAAWLALAAFTAWRAHAVRRSGARR